MRDCCLYGTLEEPIQNYSLMKTKIYSRWYILIDLSFNNITFADIALYYYMEVWGIVADSSMSLHHTIRWTTFPKYSTTSGKLSLEWDIRRCLGHFCSCLWPVQRHSIRMLVSLLSSVQYLDVLCCVMLPRSLQIQ